MLFEKKINNPNCLDYFGVRRLVLPPPHFTYASFLHEPYNLNTPFSHWITQNLNGRYYIGNSYNSKTSDHYTIVGFENSKEMTFFLMACPHTTNYR